MRNTFRGYYHPTEEETASIWEKSTITLDANVLLSLYKVLSTTSALYLSALEGKADRLWLAYQVGAEFHRNVHAERGRQTEGHAKRIGELTKVLNSIKTTAKKSRLQSTKTQEDAVASLTALAAELQADHDDIKTQNHHNKPDALLKQIADLFEKKVGPPPTEDDLAKLRNQGQERFSKKIPPGYEDQKDKDGDRIYGDYFFWQQVMDHAAEIHSDFILVTDDDKSDWWQKGGSDGKTSIAPRPELIQEFRAKTGQEILIYSSQEFYRLLLAEDDTKKSRAEDIQAAADDHFSVVQNWHDDEDRLELKYADKAVLEGDALEELLARLKARGPRPNPRKLKKSVLALRVDLMDAEMKVLDLQNEISELNFRLTQANNEMVESAQFLSDDTVDLDSRHKHVKKSIEVHEIRKELELQHSRLQLALREQNSIRAKLDRALEFEARGWAEG